MHRPTSRRRHFAAALRSFAAAAASGGLAVAQQGNPPQGNQDFEGALDKALSQQPSLEAAPAQTTPTVFGVPFRLLDVSLDGLFAVGTSTEQEDSLQELQAGGHDPHKRGFTIQNVELSLQAAVDPYMTAEAHIVYFIDPEGESQFELEEAFALSNGLPAGLQLKGGQYFVNFGRINPQHPHQWDFIDQPVINSRLFGPDGMRGPGGQLSWLTPLPWYSELLVDAHNANGETMSSFLGTDEEEAPGGHVVEDHQVESLEDLTYTARWLQSWDLREDVVTQLGFSGSWGPNSAGSGTRTSIYGADLKVKWQPRKNDKGWPFLTWQTEVMRRRYGADLQFVDPDGVPASGDEFTVPGDTLRDTGFYTYLLWGFQRDWAAGLRYDWAMSSGTGVTPREDDPNRDERHRISPMLLWQPTHFSRIRLQYNHDRASHLAHHDAHTVWLGFEFMIGAHAAHKY